MGNRRVRVAAADAGPLIHLSEIDCQSLLELFEALHIPGAVWEETSRQHRVSTLDLDNIHRHTLPAGEVDRFTQESSLRHLHIGERECLCLCQGLGVSLILTDDLAVRDAAKRLRLQPVGSLGIVVRGFRAGRLSRSEAEQDLIALYEVSSLFVTRTIVEIAIEQLS